MINDIAFKKLKSRGKKKFNLFKSVSDIKRITDGMLPSDGEIYKFISMTGGLSSITFITWVAQTKIIDELTVSTLRVGERQFRELARLANMGRLKRARYFVGSMQAEIDGKAKKYNYFKHIQDIAQKCDWKTIVINNHSKIILIRTQDDFYVLETSSNLNENPKIEQYSFANDKELYDFYYDFFNRLEDKMKGT